MTAISLLGIHLKELKIGTQTDPRMPMFIAALFTIGKRWKQPKCLLTDEWINKMWSIDTMEYYSNIKRNENLAYLQCGWTLKTLC